MYLLNSNRSLTRGRGYPFDRSPAHVSGSEHAGHARLQRQRRVLWLSLTAVPPNRASDYKTLLIAFDLLGQPIRVWCGTDKDEKGRGPNVFG